MIALDVVKAFQTEAVLVREESRRRISVMEITLEAAVPNNGQKPYNLLVLVDEILCISGDRADCVLLPIAAQGLGTVGILVAAAVTQRLHHRVNFSLKDLRQL